MNEDVAACRGRACPARRGRSKRRPYGGTGIPGSGSGAGLPVQKDRRDACPTKALDTAPHSGNGVLSEDSVFQRGRNVKARTEKHLL